MILQRAHIRPRHKFNFPFFFLTGFSPTSLVHVAFKLCVLQESDSVSLMEWELLQRKGELFQK
jgi:hypothetical protein